MYCCMSVCLGIPAVWLQVDGGFDILTHCENAVPALLEGFKKEYEEN